MGKKRSKMEEYGCGFGSVMMMLIVAAVILFGPLIMGPLTPPPVFIFLIFPAVLVAIYLYLSYASKWWRTCKCVLGFCFWIMHGCTYIIGFCLSPAIKQLVYLSSLLFACFVFASEFSFWRAELLKALLPRVILDNAVMEQLSCCMYE